MSPDSPSDYIDKEGNQGMSEKKCYSVQEIQEILGISRPTVYKLLQQNLFRSLSVGGKHIIPREGFDKWLYHGEMETKLPLV